MSKSWNVLLMIGASFCGFGGATVERYLRGDREDRQPAVVYARKLVLVDNVGRELARLRSTGAGAALEFVGRDGKNAITLGHDERSRARYLVYYGKDQAVTAALNSIGSNGESTLYLGDQRTANRVVAGALLTDVDTVPGDETDWGLVIRGPSQSAPVFRVMSPAIRPHSRAGASMFLVKEDGGEWSPQ